MTTVAVAGQIWAEWLSSQEWTWFLTITFREPCPPHRQESVINSAYSVIKSALEPARVFLGAELHLNQTIHLHGLYHSRYPEGLVKRVEKRLLWAVLFETFGRSKVETPRGNGAVSKYVSKYCVKDRGYYQIWGSEKPHDA